MSFFMEKPFIYVDNAATTKISSSCFSAMLPYIQKHYGNPSSIYSIAHTAKAAVESARKKASASIGALPEEIFFTSCATESDNWAIKCGAKLGMREGKNQIITTNFEHHAVLNACKSLESDGFEVIYLPVDKDGLISPKQVEIGRAHV